MYDLHVPIVEESRKDILPRGACLVEKGLEPLGKEYLGYLRNAFESGWIDVYENREKQAALTPGAHISPILMYCLITRVP